MTNNAFDSRNNLYASPRNPVNVPLFIDKIDAPSMKWTRYGVIIIAVLTFIQVLFSLEFPYLTMFIGLINVDIIICMFARLAKAMSAKSLYYPKDKFLAVGILMVIAQLLNYTSLMFSSYIANIISNIASIAISVYLINIGNYFQLRYFFNFGRFGNALKEIGKLMAIFGILSLLIVIANLNTLYRTEVYDPTYAFELLKHTFGKFYYVFMFFIAAISAAVTYAALWPLRIMANMMSDYDDPATSPTPPVSTLNSQSTIWLNTQSSQSQKSLTNVVSILILSGFILLMAIILLNLDLNNSHRKNNHIDYEEIPILSDDKFSNYEYEDPEY